MTNDQRRVIVCQIGARDHYAVARTLHRAGMLDELITDIWIPPASGLSHMLGHHGDRLRGRYHPALADAKVTHFTMSALTREARRAIVGQKNRWDRLIERNRWFQTVTVRHLLARKAFKEPNAKPLVLAYSYAAREILATARGAGAMSVLGQIDGGAADEALISARWSSRHQAMPDKAPRDYWADWQDECRLADRILINSDWARTLLEMVGISKRKLIVAPVIYENEAVAATRKYPQAFNASRPLRVLYLGALTLRKGVLETLEAARALGQRPVHFTIVGGDPERRADLLRCEPNITVHGHVSRSKVVDFYRDADVFLFPTHSDGFGLTQLEALASGLPVIASQYCARIVNHGNTGFLLDEVTPAAILCSICRCLDQPSQLAEMSAAALSAGAEIGRQSATAFLKTINEYTR